MGGEWKLVRLVDITSKLGDGLHGTPRYSPDGEYYFINGNNLSNGLIAFDEKTKRVDHSEFLKYQKELNSRTILVSINGTIGNIAFYNGEKVVLGKSACYFNIVDSVDKEYIRYVLADHGFQSYIEAFATGTTIKNVSLKTMREFEFNLPEVKDQKRIAHILGSLDNKITLNRQLNQTLENMAQALFKSWFVDFDPVIDNALAAGNPIPDDLQDRAERRQTQRARPNHTPLPEEISNLFPNEFELTETLGWVPKGWASKPIYSLADFVNGAAYKQFNPNAEQRGLPIVKIAELKAGITQSTGFSDIDMPAKYAIKNRDILFSWSGNPDTSIDTFVWSHGDAWLNQHIFRVDPAAEINRFFMLALLRHLNPVFAEIARDKQTTGLGHVTVKDLKVLYVVVPDENTMNLCGSKLESLFSKAFITTLNTQHVAKLRDTLLPKLISGELRIPEAQVPPEAVLG